MAVITKAQLARDLGISKARISQYVLRGMPTLTEGRLDREICINWIKSNVLPTTEGDRGAVRAGRLARDASAQLHSVHGNTSRATDGRRVDEGALEELERASRQLQWALDQLRAEPDLEQRRRMARGGVGALVGRLDRAFAAT